MRAARERSLRNPIDDSEARKDGKGVFGSQNAAGVERNQHEGPHLETARQRVRDREALQRQRRSQAPGADGEILRGRSGQGVSACDTSEECDAHWPGKRERGRNVRPWPRKIARQLGGTSRGIEVDAQHHQRRGGDRGRAVAHERVGEFASGQIARRAVKRVAGEGGDRVRDVACGLVVAAVDRDDRRQHGEAAEHSQ